MCCCEEKSFKSFQVDRPQFRGKSRVVCKKIKGVEDLKPIGDVCECGSVHVKPAVIPKPACYSPPPAPLCASDSDSFESPYVKAPYSHHDFDVDSVEDADVDITEEIKVPVDAVSLNLVQQLYRTATYHDAESKIAYGPETIPVERNFRKSRDDVPEENLYTFDRRIVELKPQTQVIKCGNGDDSEVEVKEAVKPIAFLSYSDLGYGTVRAGPKAKFVKKCKLDLKSSDEIVKDGSCGSGSSESDESCGCAK